MNQGRKIYSRWEPVREISFHLQELCKSPEVNGMENKITIAQVRVMQIVTYCSPEGIMCKDLATMLGLTPGATSRIVDRLVREGFLKRDAVQNDRRAILIRLSKKGEDIDFYHQRRLDELMKDFMSGVPQKEQELFRRMLQRLSGQVWDRLVADRRKDV